MSRLPPGAAARTGRERGLRLGISLPYFDSRLRATREPRQAAQSATGHCYHHKRYETPHDRPRLGNRNTGRRAYCGAAPCGPTTVPCQRASVPDERGWCGRRPCDASSSHRASSETSRNPGRSCGESRRRGLLASIPACRRHRLARGHRHILSPVRGSIRLSALAKLDRIRA